MAAKFSNNVLKYFPWSLFSYGHFAVKCSCKWSPWKIAKYLQSTNYFASQNSGLHSIIALILSWPPVCRKVNLLLKAAPLEVPPQLYSPSNAWTLAIADADTCTGLPSAVWNRGFSGASADLQSGSSPKSPNSDTSSILAHLHFWFPDRCASQIVIIQPTSN
jgi:hypothetical protein